MLLNSLSFYLSFSVYFDCGLVFINHKNNEKTKTVGLRKRLLIIIIKIIIIVIMMIIMISPRP